MKQHFTAQRFVLTLALFAISICIFSFRQNDTTEQKTFRKESAQTDDDTSTRRKRNTSENEFHLRDLEITLRHLDEQMLKLNEQMKNLDFSKMEKDINAATKIDHDKTAKNLEASLAKIDWKRMEAEMKASAEKVKNLDMVKMQEEIKRAASELKQQDLNIRIDAEKIKKDVSKAIADAKVSIEKAKVEIRLMKDFTNELDRDGLIDKKKPFKIELKAGELYLNDKKQPENVTDKYKKYYRKDNFTISSDGKEGEGAVI